MPSAGEDSPPTTGSNGGGAIWLTITKPLSFLREKFNTFRLNYIISSNQARQPPVLPISAPVPSQQQLDTDLHPITQMMREQELGRVIITLAVPAAVAVLTSCNNNGKLLVAHFVTVGLMMGCMAIWNGILFRSNFPRLANVLEEIGISFVLLSLYGFVAASLPKGFSWILWLSAAFCLIPVIISLLPYLKHPSHQQHC